MRKIVSIFLVSLLALSLCAIVFHKQLLVFSARLVFHGATLTYESGNWEGNTVSFSGAKISTKSGTSATFSQIEFTYDFSFSSPFFTSKLHFHDPEVVVLDSKGKSSHSIDPYRLFSSGLFKQAFEVSGGHLSLKGERVPFLVECDGITSQSTIGGGTSGELFISTERIEKEIRFTCSAKELSLPFVSKILDASWKSERGTIDGTLLAVLSKRASPKSITYDLRADDIMVTSRDLGVEVDHFSAKRDEEAFEDHPLFKEGWPYLLCSGKIDGARIRYADQEITCSGMIYFEEEMAPSLSIKGDVLCFGEQFPFTIEGSAGFGARSKWNSHLDLSVGSEGSTLVSLLGDGKLIDIDGSVKHMRLDLFGNLLKYDILKGDGSGNFSLSVRKNKVSSVKIEQVRLGQLRGRYNDVAFDIERARGAFSMEIAKPEEARWHADLHGGNLEYQKRQIRSIDGHLDVRQGSIVGSYINGVYDGVPGKIRCEGYYKNAAVHLSFEKYDWLFEVSTRVKKLPAEWKVGGDLRIDKGDGVEDRIDFGSLINKSGSVSSGWFSAKSVSAPVINVPISEAGYEWRLLGHFDLEGEINSSGIAIDFDTRDGGFLSHYVNASLDPLDHTLEKGERKLFFDRKQNKWSGVIPIAKAQASLNQVDLPLSDLSGVVLIDNNSLTLQNGKASSYDIELCTQVDLEFISGDVADIEVTANRIDGPVEGIFSFVSHFYPVAFPLSGWVTSGENGFYLKTRVGEEGAPFDWRFDIALTEGKYQPTPLIGASEVLAQVSWNSMKGLCSVTDLEGRVDFSDATYKLNVPSVTFDHFDAATFDARLEASTHDIFRIVGVANRNEKGVAVELVDGKAHLFGSKARLSKCQLTPEFAVESLGLSISISCHDLINQCVLLTDLGLMDVKDSTIDELRSLKVEGLIDMNIDIDGEGENISFSAKSEAIKADELPLTHFTVELVKEGPLIELKQLGLGDVTLTAAIEKDLLGFSVPKISGTYGESSFAFSDGKYRFDTAELFFPKSDIILATDDVLPFVPYSFDHSFIEGAFAVSGKVSVDFSEGIRHVALDADLLLASQNLGKGELNVTSTKPFQLAVRDGKELVLSNGALRVFKGNLWASCELNTVALLPNVQGEDLTISLPPEMLLYLCELGMVPLDVFKTISWENQIDASLCFDANSLSCSLRDGYYWIGDKSWHLRDISASYKDGTAEAHAQIAIDDHHFTVNGSLNQNEGKLKIHEEGQKADPLVITGVYNDGISFSRIEGEVCGLTMSFEKNAITSMPAERVLTGHIKVDVPKLATFFSDKVKQFVSGVGVGKGYELRGDIVLPKGAFFSSYFKGFLKAKHFELMGSRLQTLMGEITLSPSQILVSDLTLSDDAGIFSLDHLDCTQTSDGKWLLTIPKLSVNDFRPSLLKKIGRYRGRMKPMIIRDILFSNIRGEIGDRNSFTGVGNLSFENSFKKESNLLTVPFEIIARLGLDTALLMPVQGRLEYQIRDGRIYFTELNDSYSDGKRSRFFLSPSRPSFIDFDGDLNINVKMKQYVLLKVTEPFTLSIHGNLDKPKYSLN